MEIETKLACENARTLNAALIHKKLKGDTSRIKKMVDGDFDNLDYQRGVMFGISMALMCDGLPAFLSGENAEMIHKHFLVIFTGFDLGKIVEAEATA